MPVLEVIALAELDGSGRSLPSVIELCADWINSQSPNAPSRDRACFNLGTELYHRAGAR
jgi:hypothetical protein